MLTCAVIRACVCPVSIDGDRKEADLAYLFKSLLTVAEELYSDLQPVLRATDSVSHHKNRDSSAIHVTQKHNNRLIYLFFLLYNTLLYLISTCTQTHTHINTGHVEVLCIKKTE